MPELTLDDGRKAEKVESNFDSLTKVTELFVEPKVSKRLTQRVIERFCVCERETQTVNEDTGEVVDKFVESFCSGGAATVVHNSGMRNPMKAAVESKVLSGSKKNLYIFGAIILVQVLALVCILFFM